MIIAARVIFDASLLLLLVATTFVRRRNKGRAIRMRNQALWARLLFVGCEWLTLTQGMNYGLSGGFLPNSLRVTPPKAMTLVGACMWLLGALLIGWARLTLGPNWISGIGWRAGHSLTTNGPYRFVRHPIYSGYVLLAIGLVTASVSIVCCIPALIMTVGLIGRTAWEEQEMSKLFGEEYARYAERTGALIPGIGRWVKA